MLKKAAEIDQPTKKRVQWDPLVENNEGTIRTKRQRTTYYGREHSSAHQKSIEKIVNSLKPYLFKSDGLQLEDMLNIYSPDDKVNILSTGVLFRAAALASNIEALRFIIKTVPQNVACTMLHNRNAFESFLCHEYALEELAKSDHQRRVEGFKIFLEIDHEFIQKAFNTFDSKWHQTTYQLSLRDDFKTALAQS
jgi:hypothetical protein